MKFTKVYFLKSSTKPENYPVFNYPEFAFLGKSNVGKSSLLNYLLGRKNLVKTGATPGVTQLINFFIADDKISFADLPGYGFAKVPAKIKNNFENMITTYLETRKNLRIVFLLIDIRRTPSTYEKEMITQLSELNIPTAIVATKADKLTRNQQNKQISLIAKELDIDKSNIFMTSAAKGIGKKEIISLISDYSAKKVSIDHN